VDKQWSNGRAVTRLATAGLAAVLVVLTGFGLWAAFSTSRAIRQVDRLSRLSDAYQQARYAVATEQGLERKYRLEPGPEVRADVQQTAASLLAALEVWVPVIRSPHATCAYSWISPPSRSRRTTLPAGTTTADSTDPSGGAWPKARCGRWTL
jgi:hypothetical protein